MTIINFTLLLARRHFSLALGVEKRLASYESPGDAAGELMKRFVSGADRAQSMLLPECLDYFIDESNRVRVIDAFVDALNVAELGFDGVEPAAPGDRPIILPRSLNSTSMAIQPGTIEPPAGTLANFGKQRLAQAVSHRRTLEDFRGTFEKLIFSNRELTQVNCRTAQIAEQVYDRP